MEMRKHTRITAEPRCTASFQLDGEAYRDIPVSNLGVDGCCFEVPAESANAIRECGVLERVELHHPGLPKQSVMGKVVWVHGKRGADQSLLETGIQFSGLPDGYAQEVDRYIAALLKFNPRMSV